MKRASKRRLFKTVMPLIAALLVMGAMSIVKPETVNAAGNIIFDAAQNIVFVSGEVTVDEILQVKDSEYDVPFNNNGAVPMELKGDTTLRLTTDLSVKEIKGDYKLTVTGSGSLTIKGDTDYNYCLNVKRFEMNEGVVSVNCSYLDTEITISGGTMTVRGPEPDPNAPTVLGALRHPPGWICEFNMLGGELILEHASVHTTDANIGGDARISGTGSVLVGNTVIKDNADVSIERLIESDLSISGGNVIVKSIRAGQLNISGGSLIVNNDMSNSVDADVIQITGGSVIISSVADSSYRPEVYARGGFNVHGGTVSISSKCTNQPAVSSGGQVIVTGGSLEVASDNNIGIKSAAALVVRGDTTVVSVKGTPKAIESSSVLLSNPIGIETPSGGKNENGTILNGDGTVATEVTLKSTGGGTTPVTNPVITPANASASVKAGNQYRGKPFTVSEGTGPYTWSARCAELPGLSCSTDGTLTVTPATAGDYTIDVTVTDSNGRTASATLKLTVTANTPNPPNPPIPPVTPLTKIEVTPKTSSLDKGKTVQLTTTTTPSSGATDTVLWRSSNTSVATVDQNGTVTGVAPGTAVITAYSSGNNTVKDEANVTVKDVTPPINNNNNVSVNTSQSKGGKVTGGGAYRENETVTLTATADNGFKFVHWANASDPKNAVSKNATYTFTAGKGTSLTAVFAPESLSYTEGKNGTWKEGDSSKLTFRTNGTYELFTHITVDGKRVSGDDSEILSGSTIIRLKPSYLDTLSTGSHQLEAYYSDGTSIRTQFEIKAGESSSTPAPVSVSSSGASTSSGGQNATGYTTTTVVQTNAQGARSAESSEVLNARMARTGDDMYRRLVVHTMILFAALMFLVVNIRIIMVWNARQAEEEYDDSTR